MRIEYGCSYLDAYALVDNMVRIEPKNNVLTWNLLNTDDINKDTAKEIISLAFKEIEGHISPIVFHYSTSWASSDIKIAFTNKKQEVNSADEKGDTVRFTSPFHFDGQFGTLAVGFYPIEGDLRGVLLLDMEEKWSNRHDSETGEIDLQTVALHEILHVLGLKHSKDKKAVMFSAYDGEKREMNSDDITAIREIYKDRVDNYVPPKQSWFLFLVGLLKNLFQKYF